MIIRPIYQTKHVQVEMTQPEVDALKELKMAVAKVISCWSAGGYADAEARMDLKLAFAKAPEISEEPPMVMPK